MSEGYTQQLMDCREVGIAGGKAAQLGRLMRAGFPVPGGFVVTTQSYVAAREQWVASGSVGTIKLTAEGREEIGTAYRAMGAGVVAVRSSATAEDMGNASMAGQYETFLDVEGEADLLEKIEQCWASLQAPRIQAYLREYAIDPATVAMAVVVQRLVAADVAGVLFTTNPTEGRASEMLLEASWGLGESVVSGRVQPDVLRLEQQTGRVVSALISDKRVELMQGSHAERAVEESRRRVPCLKGREVHRLWELGRKAAEQFETPQDIEWAIRGGEFYVLQSRPITTIGGTARADAETYEELLRETREWVRNQLDAGRGPWTMHNLSETLNHPTPLTWSVVQQFMSGGGGMGYAYREIGFTPGPAVERDGGLACIAGRIFTDVARAPEMFSANYPLAYDVDVLRKNADTSQTMPSLPRGSAAERTRSMRQMAVVSATLMERARLLDGDLRAVHFPAMQDYVKKAAAEDLSSLAIPELIERWNQHQKFVLDEFGPLSLLPSLVAGMALSQLKEFLSQVQWSESAEVLSQLISSATPANQTVIADEELLAVGRGRMTMDAWLESHGHRAPGEFDLAVPRWREQPEVIQKMAQQLAAAGVSPLARHRDHGMTVRQKIEKMQLRMSTQNRRAFDRHIELVRRYLPFREDAKDVFMKGYALLRQVALEMGSRLDIGTDVFFLSKEDLIDALRVGYAPLHLIEQRKRSHRAQSRLPLPRFIDEQSLATLGNPPTVAAFEATGSLRGLGISSGRTRGIVRIRHSPTEAGDFGTGYILVCPSTDPSWTPLFVNAAGLVLECGGTLSHGAVVAREMGLPAVVIQDATRLFTEGEELVVDGTHGVVERGSDEQVAATAPAHADETLIADEELPPVEGRRDIRGRHLRNVWASIWAVYLSGFFLLPAVAVKTPTLQLMDTLLWPLIRAGSTGSSNWGRPAAVAMVAIGIAFITLLMQKMFTDNERLLVAKRRAALLQEQAERCPVGSARRAALLNAAAPIPARTFRAALVPLGLLLGPLVVPFSWFADRMEPATWNAAAGSPLQVVAKVDGEWKKPVKLVVDAPFVIDSSTPAERTLPPLRSTLEHLLALYRQTPPQANQAWEIQAAPDVARETTVADLDAYLKAGISPQGVMWKVRVPAGFDGVVPMRIVAGDQAPLTVTGVVGNSHPPTEGSAKNAASATVREARIVYPPPQTVRSFWRPLSWMPGQNRFAIAARVASWDIEWLWWYVVVYVVALPAVRRVLKVA